jgi:hypothetical protein
VSIKPAAGQNAEIINLTKHSFAYEKSPTLRHFEFASGEVTQCGEDAGKGVLEARRTYFRCPLGRCPDQERQRRIGKPAKRKTPKSIGDAEPAF